ncbi:unnamed protein product [Linum tenue]|uniref:GH16 domain-containing protein n=1 Tax=Linum tenue TaxID=586396 RepID=A0AAV0H5L8_9ROSI|nr:unnamed protein product [Linum tenue]
MADPTLHHGTQPINQIVVDYTPEACTHCPKTNSITLTYHRGDARWRSTNRFLYCLMISVMFNPSGLILLFMSTIMQISSLEGNKSQDEIDFEFVGKDKTVVQTNYYTAGSGNREQIHDLGFDCSDWFHEYIMKWSQQQS